MIKIPEKLTKNICMRMQDANILQIGTYIPTISVPIIEEVFKYFSANPELCLKLSELKETDKRQNNETRAHTKR